MRPTRLTRTCFISVVLLLSVWAVSGPAGAAINDCGQRGNYFEGTVNDLPSFNFNDGSRADIKVRKAALCQTEFTTSSAWSMVARTGFLQVGWAQVGYVHRSNHDFAHFVQTRKSDADCCTTRYVGDPDPGDEFEYRVARRNIDGHFHMLRCLPNNGDNCIEYLETTWDPHNVWNSSNSQFAGETFHRQTDIPGVTDNRADFTRVREMQPDDDWVNGDLDYVNGGVDRYRFNFIDQRTHFEIWTFPLN